eukprot:TRINITY_DN1803_c0_g1_i1.p1 TRINITY_DN1803_c0_g1~~TRINITY_DN1803_c0_g1_i1.p1  ORF type:complete len:212 (+),score=86.35 TRINITY_DN1803_c0_g1_i1:1-636(+)
MSTKNLVFTGDSPSLWNVALSPGWSKDELETLRLAIMKFGVGKQTSILESGCLPGKTKAQINGQTQRLLGQQSLGEFMGINLDPVKVHEENLKRKDVVRKNGIIINTGNNVSREEMKKKKEENTEKFGLSSSDIDKIELPNPSRDEERLNEARRTRLEKLKSRLELLEGIISQRENGTISITTKVSTESKRATKKVKVEEQENEDEDVDIE